MGTRIMWNWDTEEKQYLLDLCEYTCEMDIYCNGLSGLWKIFPE